MSTEIDLKELEEQAVKEIEKIPQETNVENIKDFRREVLTLLASRKRDEATELLTEKILTEFNINTIRDDDKTEMYILKDGIRVRQAASYIKEFVRNIVGFAYTQQLGNCVIEKIAADTLTDADNFFNHLNPNRICLENGIFDLKTGKLDPINEDEFHFQKLPITYVTDAKCENIIKFFNDILPSKHDVNIIQELLGYMMFKDYVFGKAFMFNGVGRNGKGATVRLMKKFLGVENVSNVPLQQLESDTFAAGELFNKLANLSADISSKALTESGMFKSLTGQDMISANRKFLTRINFVNYAKMVFCANELPRTSDLSLAFFNRWVILDFPYVFLSPNEYDLIAKKDNSIYRKIDPDIENKISTNEEMSGLFNWAYEGLKRLFRNSGFSYSFSTEQTKIKWMRMSDSFNAFCMDCLCKDYECGIKKKDLRLAYNDYCRKHKLKSSTDKVIKAILSETFGCIDDRYRDKQVGDDFTYWSGIKFNTSKDNDMVDKGNIRISTYMQTNISKESTKTHGSHASHDNSQQVTL